MLCRLAIFLGTVWGQDFLQFFLLLTNKWQIFFSNLNIAPFTNKFFNDKISHWENSL
jgi:hypothetical protein